MNNENIEHNGKCSDKYVERTITYNSRGQYDNQRSFSYYMILSFDLNIRIHLLCNFENRKNVLIRCTECWEKRIMS